MGQGQEVKQEAALAIEHASEIRRGERFAFGENWARFLRVLDESRIQLAVESLKDMLEVENLEGRSFLDIGSGSGLFSLAARRLGARVYSFDYDPQSVECTRELRRRYFAEDPAWEVHAGSVLDASYVESLGVFDVVYSWGVLHHTGSMWTALRNAETRVAANGACFIALYNDQGGASSRWRAVKKAYVSLPTWLRWIVLVPAYVWLWGPTMLLDVIRGRPFAGWRNYKHNSRGMSPRRDVIDWVGGYPFEVAKPEQVFDFFRSRKYGLMRLSTCAGGIGCNQFVFRKL
jgi:2-polyprenyl-6-hydroxyphenyl methylase/3-demethylubiquinone-9 3-methyltransferase